MANLIINCQVKTELYDEIHLNEEKKINLSNVFRTILIRLS